MNRWFNVLATYTARQCGRSGAFIIACVVVIVWVITGPIFAYSDTWQLVINTGTTVVTFLMVFLMQNTQTRDSAAMQAKLDELIRVNADASDSMMRAETKTQEEIEELREGDKP